MVYDYLGGPETLEADGWMLSVATAVMDRE
jgi:hypothetical protein